MDVYLLRYNIHCFPPIRRNYTGCFWTFPLAWMVITSAMSRSVVQSCLDSATPWTVARQAPLSMGFSRQEYRSGLPFPPPGDLPNSWIESTSPAFPALRADSFYCCAPGKPNYINIFTQIFVFQKNHWYFTTVLRRGSFQGFQTC